LRGGFCGSSPAAVRLATGRPTPHVGRPGRHEPLLAAPGPAAVSRAGPGAGVSACPSP